MAAKTNNQATAAKATFWKAYNILDRGEDKKAFWNPVGVAFPNKDGSFNIKLSSLPLDGEIHIRPYEPRSES